MMLKTGVFGLLAISEEITSLTQDTPKVTWGLSWVCRYEKGILGIQEFENAFEIELLL